MSMINKQIEGLRKMVKYHAGIYPDVVKALKDAADTIEHLSIKVNNPHDRNLCDSCVNDGCIF